MQGREPKGIVGMTMVVSASQPKRQMSYRGLAKNNLADTPIGLANRSRQETARAFFKMLRIPVQNEGIA